MQSRDVGAAEASGVPVEGLPTVLVDRPLIERLRRQLESETGAPVTLTETHISWVLLTQRVAYKLKKPVRLPFVDFSTLALRKHFCEEELRLNRPLAPSLYLSVLPICGTEQAPHVDGPGKVIDYAVCMRRFEAGALLSERLAAGTLQAVDLENLAARLTKFHKRAPVVVREPDSDAALRVIDPVLRVLEELRRDPDTERLDALARWFASQAKNLRATWTEREDAGMVRECHGDLHLANTVLINGEAMAFDCIEFDPALRRIDVMSDIAFLTMDLKANGRDDLAFCFLDAYLQGSGDYAGVAALRFYEVYRALVRMLVSRLVPRPDGVGAPGPDFLACAERIAGSAIGTPPLLITHGLSGSGKSTVAKQLLETAGAIRLRSDVERKRLFGMTALDRSSDRARLYSPEATRRTFEHLAECARTALRAGYPVIVDAAFLCRAGRDVFRAVAADLRVPFTILHCTADPALLRQRVAMRNASGHDASDADLGVLERQIAHDEALSGEEREYTVEVATDVRVDADALAKRWLARATVPVRSFPSE